MVMEVILDFPHPAGGGGDVDCYGCWKVVAYAVANYYDPNTAWTDCTIANEALNRPDCCTDPPACRGLPSDMQVALGVTGNFASMTGSVGINNIKDNIIAELQAGRPVCARIDYSASSHFIAIYGYAEYAGPEDNHVFIFDPHVGSHDHFGNLFFAGDYYGWKNEVGSWTATYFTQA